MNKGGVRGELGVEPRARKKVLILTSAWMKAESGELHEIDQTQKDSYCMNPLLRGTQSIQNRILGKQTVASRVVEKWSLTAEWIQGVSFTRWKDF